MFWFGRVLLLAILVGLMVQPLEARPEFFEMFRVDPFRNPEFTRCDACHANVNGGGPRNEFGLAFDEGSRVITPMLRAAFPDRFVFETAQLPDGSTFYFSDPESQYVVAEIVEKDDDDNVVGSERYLIDLVAVATGGPAGGEGDVAVDRMGFFITSAGPGNGGDLGGLAGADQHCQSLAEAAGADRRTWRAYLSTSFDGEPIINAGDRIGGGPWYNANGLLIARGVTDLHIGNNRMSQAMSVSETGDVINGRGDDPNRHDILTGTLSDGTTAVDMNCNNWTSSDAGSALLGHHDREGGGDNGPSWNSAHASRSCSQEDLQATGGDGLFYCFAID